MTRPALTERIKDYMLGNMKRPWVISYIIVLLLPLTLSSFVYLNAYNTIKDQAQESQKSAVERLSSNMDNEFRRIEEFVSVLSYDNNVNYLLHATGLESFTQNYATASRLYDLNQSLLVNLPSGSFISDYYIFSPDNSLVFHNSGVNEIEAYAQVPGNNTKLLYDKCRTLDTGEVQLFSLENDAGQFYMAAVYPLPYSYLPKGYMVILLDSSRLNELMLSLYSQEHSQIYLVDAQNLVLNRPDIPSVSALQYASGSQVLPLTYICTLPESVATASLIYLRQALWIIGLCCIIGGGFLIFLLTRYNYSPWLKLLTTIQNLSKSSIENGMNEYQIVQTTLTNIFQEKATMEEVFHRQSRALYSYYLTRLLKGHIEVDDMDETILENMEQLLLLDNYTILVSLTDVRDSWTTDYTDLARSTYLSFFEKQIVRKLQDFLGETFSVSFTEIYDYTVCVIGMLEQETDSWQVKLSAAMETIISDISEHMDLQYYFAFSDLHHNITEMYTAWEEASSSISIGIMNQEKTLTFYEDVEFHNPGSYAYTAKTEQTLINLIQIGQAAEAAVLIRELLDEIAAQYPVFETAKCAATDVLCSVTKAFTHLPAGVGETLQNEYYNLVENFMQANSYKKLQKPLLTATALVAAGFEQARTAANTPQSNWIPKIDEQLEANLYNENLNVMFLAHKLGINSKYISSLYFEAKGVSIVDTIHRRRIETFKEILGERDISIADAAAAVGYSSIATLNRWVRKYEGVTPGQLKPLKHTTQNTDS